MKVGGERLYRLAHRGEEAETPEREVEVHRADLLEADSERASYEIECATGTYVRSLIETLEDAYCEDLRRTAIGPFGIEGVGEEPLPVEEVLGFLPERPLGASEAERVRHGAWVEAGDAPEAPMRLTHEGAVVAVGRREGDAIRPEVVLSPP